MPRSCLRGPDLRPLGPQSLAGGYGFGAKAAHKQLHTIQATGFEHVSCQIKMEVCMHADDTILLQALTGCGTLWVTLGCQSLSSLKDPD